MSRTTRIYKGQQYRVRRERKQNPFPKYFGHPGWNWARLLGSKDKRNSWGHRSISPKYTKPLYKLLQKGLKKKTYRQKLQADGGDMD